MAQTLTLKVRGLYTSDNDLSAVPDGALSRADNIVIDRQDIGEPRRGFDQLSAAFGTASHRASQLWSYQDKLFAHTTANQLQYWSGSAWTALSGTYTKPTNAIRVRAAEANQNLYLTTSAGIYKQDLYSSTPAKAGAFKGLDLEASIPGVPTAAWLADDNRVTYRLVWGYKDLNGNLILGAPSQRESVRNVSGAPSDVSVTSTIPAGVTTAWFYQLYRSAAVADVSGDVENNDELQLVYEGNPTGPQITAGTVTILDIVPDALRGALLYTSGSQEGLAKGNEQPPAAGDMVDFKGHMFYADVTSKHRFYLTVLAAGAPNGVQANDTITIGGISYTAKAAETVASAQFKVFSAGSAAQNVRDTALSLVRVINRHTSSTVYAYYLSGSGETPGKILLEERSIGGASFAVIASRATSWNPILPTSGTTQSSSADAYPNGLMWSKPGQPEAVPLPHAARAGSKNKRILRIVPIKDTLFILKEDGIFRLNGENADSFQIEPFNDSVKLIAPESCAVLEGQLYCLTDQGVVTITETGVSVVSIQIKKDLLRLFGASLSAIETYSFGVFYDSDNKYILWTISTSADTSATQAFVYSTITNAWTRWDLSKTCGLVAKLDDKDKLYLGDASSAYVNIERKAYDFTDHVDYGFASTITDISVDNLTVTLGSLVDQVEVGDVIYQSSTVFGIVTAVDTVAATVTVEAEAEWTVAACDILKAIDTVVEWIPTTAGNPGATKQFHTTILLFETVFTGEATLSFATDLDSSTSDVTITGSSNGNWGLFPWGSGPWGGEAASGSRRTWIPATKQVCSQITPTFSHRVGFSSWELAGLVLHFNPGSDRVVA